jgi:hypothetical protein
MFEKLLVVLLPVIFLISFFMRNIMVRIHTKERIRSSDPILTTSIVFVSLSFLATILSTCSDRFYEFTMAIPVLKFHLISYSGIMLFATLVGCSKKGDPLHSQLFVVCFLGLWFSFELPFSQIVRYTLQINPALVARL